MVLRPNISINVRSNLALIEAAGPGVIAILGTAQWGPLDEVRVVTSLNEALNIYADDSTSDTNLTLIKGLDLLYRTGAGQVKCLRVANGSESTSGIMLLSGATSVIQLSSYYEGAYGNNISVTVTTNGSNRDLTITDGISVESYTNAGNGYDTNSSIVSVINANSALVTATVINSTFLVDALTSTNLSGGANGSSSLSSSNYTTAYDTYLQTEEFDIIVVPGTTADAFQSTMLSKMNSRESNDNKFTIFISGIGLNETIATATTRTATGRRLSLVAPSVVYTNRISGEQETLDGSFLACAYAGLVATGYPAISPTHKPLAVEGVFVDTTTSKKYYNNGEQEQLLETRIVPITLIGGSIMPSRAVTRNGSTTEVYYEQNIVTIIDYIKTQVYNALIPFIGDPNIQRIRNVMAKNLDGILQQDKLDEIIEDYQSTVVNVGTSPDTVEVQLTIQPSFAINFIKVNMVIDNIS